MRELVQRWADDLQYPLAVYERDSLAQVSQYRTVDQSRFTAEREWLTQLRTAIGKKIVLPEELKDSNASVGKILELAGKQLREQDKFEPHRALARLPVKVYITANNDELLESALREVKREPLTMVCPWREFSEKTDPIMYSMNCIIN
ncbi:MAG: hypothetical protein EHM81_03385 [Chloroflexi bacterium]|nr:MAG: hypothetical protein EHM81_03385 [Chloroflexota bacterium]